MVSEKVITKTEAVFSDDREHRFLLRKEWDAKKLKATVIMTNPSMADMVIMDYTTLYIQNNLHRLDFGSFDIVNLVSKVTIKLDIKKDMDSPAIVEENTGYIVKSAEKADRVIVAWGKLGENNKAIRVIQDRLLDSLRPFKDKLYVIAAERGDSGFHPLAPQIRFSWFLKKFDLPVLADGKPEK